jgi:nitric oxide synthase-interacting protein
VACQSGHLACKECLYESILTQKQEIQRQQRLSVQRQKENDEQKALEDEKAQLAILANFERTQTSVLPDNRRHSTAQSAEFTNKPSPSGSRETSKDPNTPSGSSPAIGKFGSMRASFRECCVIIGVDDHVNVESSPQLHAGTKRKFELNQEERQRAIDKEKEEALRKINEARSEEAKPKLPSFWLVSIVPSDILRYQLFTKVDL